MKNKYINIPQYCSILIIIIIASFFGIGITRCINYSGVDTWISIIFSLLIGSILILMFNYINDYEPTKNLSQKINRLFNKRFSFIIRIIIIIYFFSILLTSMCNILIYITTQFLIQTPLLFLSIFFFLVITYINFKGMEVISRVSFIIVFINFTLSIISILGLINDIDLSNLLPILNKGVKPVFNSSFFILIDNLLPIFLLLAIPKELITRNKSLNKYIYLSFIFSIIIILLVTIFTIGSLGIDLTKLYKYPEYIVLKNISLFRFLDNMENIINIQWILGLYIIISISIFSIQSSISSYKCKKILIILPSILSIRIIKIFFISDSIFEYYLLNYTPYIKSIFLSTIIIICIKIYITKKTIK